MHKRFVVNYVRKTECFPSNYKDIIFSKKFILAKKQNFRTFVFYSFHLYTMRKFYLPFLLIFFSVSTLSAYNPFREYCHNIIPENYRKGFSSDLSILQKLVGDSICFETNGAQLLTTVYQTYPDTIWLKEKRSKKPKEGKDYVLTYLYRAQKYGDVIYTSGKDMINKKFGVVSVREHFAKGASSASGYQFILTEPGTTGTITFIYDTSFSNPWTIRSQKSKRLEKALIGKKHYYWNSKITDVYPMVCSGADYYVKLSPTSTYVEALPIVNLKTRSAQKGKFDTPIEAWPETKHEITPYQLESKFSNILNFDFISEEYYQKLLEEERIAKEKERLANIEYTLPHEWPDSIISHPNFTEDYILCIQGVVKNYSYISQKIKARQSKVGNDCSLSGGTSLYIIDRRNIRGTDFFIAAKDGAVFFIEADNVDCDHGELQTLLSANASRPEEEINLNIAILQMTTLNEWEKTLQKANADFNKAVASGIGVLDFDIYSMGEYSDALGVNFEVLNSSKKTIKYITVNFSGYNAVDDPVPAFGKKVITRRCIGPIESWNSGRYTFDYVWYNNITEYVAIKSLVVEYMDGTKRTFTGKNVEVIDEDIIDATNVRSPVESLWPSLTDD